MKTILLILLFSAGLCLSQTIAHKAIISTSKDSVKSDEKFTVTYSLTDVHGYVYIGVKDGYFETIGNDRWEGEIKEGETKTVTFTVKLKDSSKKWIQRKVPLLVGFSYKPFDKRISAGKYEQKNLIITDFDKIKDSSKKAGCNSKASHPKISPSGYNTTPVNKEFKADTTIIKQQK